MFSRTLLSGAAALACLAGSAMAFERGWVSLHQMLAARPSGVIEDGSMRGAQSDYPFNRDYMAR